METLMAAHSATGTPASLRAHGKIVQLLRGKDVAYLTNSGPHRARHGTRSHTTTPLPRKTALSGSG